MISKHFHRAEFECKCGCGYDTVDHELITVLEDIRESFGKVTINSGARCIPHNKEVGGSPDSQHLDGKAGDIVVENVRAEIIADYLETMYPNKYGIGRYTNPARTHIDVRPEKARWTA